MKANLQEVVVQALKDVFSAKFFVLIASTLLLLDGKLNENNWIMLVMMIAGLKEAHTIATTLKGGGTIQVNNTTNQSEAGDEPNKSQQ